MIYQEGKYMSVADDTIIEAINDAIEKEQEAQRFYKETADMVDHEDVSNFFLELRDDEIDHERLLSKMRDRLRSGSISLDRIMDVDDHDLADLGISRYLKEPEADELTGYQEAMVIAMKREEGATRNYAKMARMTDNEEMKGVFTLLSQVEAGHLRRLEALYEKEILEGY